MSAIAQAPDAATQIAGLIFAVLLVDSDNCVREANPAAEELLSRSASRLQKMTLFDALAIENGRLMESLENSEARVIARGVTIETGSGVKRVNLTSSPMHSHQGWRVISLSEVGQDGHDADDIERVELRAPAVLAHEIKNPLSAIRGASQLLARRASERDRPLATMIEGEVDRIAQLIDRMQQLGSRSPVKTGPCNLHESIRNAMATVRAGRDDG